MYGQFLKADFDFCVFDGSLLMMMIRRKLADTAETLGKTKMLEKGT